MPAKTIGSHRRITTELKKFILQQAHRFNGRALEDGSIEKICQLVKEDQRFRRDIHPRAVRRLLQAQIGGGNPRPTGVGNPPHQIRRRHIRVR
jgi:hypothetical protein